MALALVLAFASGANAAQKPKLTVTLQEFTMLVLPSAETKAGTVPMKVINTGSLTHEMVLVRAVR